MSKVINHHITAHGWRVEYDPTKSKFAITIPDLVFGGMAVKEFTLDVDGELIRQLAELLPPPAVFNEPVESIH